MKSRAFAALVALTGLTVAAVKSWRDAEAKPGRVEFGSHTVTENRGHGVPPGGEARD
ncbi:hypothetical protein QJS66_14480 [Kocuria rhizophila]|nr:hypothetical protein QJS66_14480 [Kocuria rhizophila]